jgi:hypothetical protein
MARSRGLLAVCPEVKGMQISSQVYFSHRSVREFLESEEMAPELRRMAGNFDTTRSLLQAALWELKSFAAVALADSEKKLSLKYWSLEYVRSSLLRIAAEASSEEGPAYVREVVAADRMVSRLASISVSPDKKIKHHLDIERVGLYCWVREEKRILGQGKQTKQGMLYHCCYLGLKDFISIKVSEMQSQGTLTEQRRQHMLLMALLGAATSRPIPNQCQQLVSFLVEQGALLNGIVSSFPLMTSDERYSDMGQIFLKGPRHTVWSLFLYVCFRVGWKYVNDAGFTRTFRTIENCLKLGADPTVKFVGFPREILLPGEGERNERVTFGNALRFDLAQATKALRPPNDSVILKILQERQAAQRQSFWERASRLSPTLASKAQCPERIERFEQKGFCIDSMVIVTVGNLKALQHLNEDWLKKVCDVLHYYWQPWMKISF